MIASASSLVVRTYVSSRTIMLDISKILSPFGLIFNNVDASSFFLTARIYPFSESYCNFIGITSLPSIDMLSFFIIMVSIFEYVP